MHCSVAVCAPERCDGEKYNKVVVVTPSGSAVCGRVQHREVLQDVT